LSGSNGDTKSDPKWRGGDSHTNHRGRGDGDANFGWRSDGDANNDRRGKFA
jgi:hypothetical protein